MSEYDGLASIGVKTGSRKTEVIVSLVVMLDGDKIERRATCQRFLLTSDKDQNIGAKPLSYLRRW